MKLNVGLVIDFGNSGTRVELKTSTKGNHIFFLDNSFAALEGGYAIPARYRKNGESCVFNFNGKYFSNGELARTEFDKTLIRPSAVEKKSEQLTTKLSFTLAMIKAIELMSSLFAVPASTLDVAFRVTAVMPPQEHEVRKAEFEKMLSEITSVDSVMPMTFKMSVVITSVTAHPEGFAGFIGAMYEEVEVEGVKTLVNVAENQSFESGKTLILDIGAGTTDTGIISDCELIEKSKDTFPIGGNTVTSNLRNAIDKHIGFPPGDLSEAVQSGILTEAEDVQHDVSKYLDLAKREYASALTERLTQYLERLMIQPRELKGLLIFGGGSLPAYLEVDGTLIEKSPAMAVSSLEYIKKLAPNIKSLYLGNKNPRHLNLIGASLMHTYMDSNN